MSSQRNQSPFWKGAFSAGGQEKGKMDLCKSSFLDILKDTRWPNSTEIKI